MTINYDKIPAELREQAIWLLWRYETVKERRTKVPYQTNGFKASSTNPATWTSFDNAVKAFVIGGYDGLGVGISGDLAAVDIDGCVDDLGMFDGMAEDIIATMDTYTEYSPSGKGLRLFFKAPGFQYDKARYYINNQKAGLEIYIAGCTHKYLTVTGNVVADKPIAERSDAITAVLEEYMVRPNDQAKEATTPTAAGRAPAVTTSPPIGDWDVVDLIRKSSQAELFKTLFDYGDVSKYNNDDSAADMALCNILASWTNTNADQMERLFDQSALGERDKWKNRADYRQMTIDKAIKDCKWTYKYGLAIHTAKEDFSEVRRVQKQVDVWEKPRPFDEEKLPPFPVECLPDSLKRFVIATAESLQVAVDMTAVAGLATCALCVQRKLKVMVKRGWCEPLNLYTTIVAGPGEKKSPVAASMLAPIYNYEKTYNEFIQPEIDAYQVKHNVLVKKVKALEDKAAGIKSGKPKKGKEIEWDGEINNDSGINDVLEKRRELADLEAEEPKRLCLWADDATPEALTSLLAENDGRMGVLSAEGGLFDILAGRYSNGVNIDAILKAHNGDQIKVNRKGREPEYIENPSLTLFLAIQPYVLEGLMDNATFRGRGLTARFLYSIPQSRAGTREYDTEPVPEAVRQGYETVIQRLLAVPLPLNEDILELSPGAQELSREFFYWLEPQFKGSLENIADWVQKLHGTIFRIAGVLHCIEHGINPINPIISTDTTRNAIELGKYFLEHAQAAYRLMGADKATVDAQYILRMLNRDRPTEITRTELNQLCHGRFKKAEDMDPGVGVLIEYEYLREYKEFIGYNNRVRVKYFINPMTYGIDSIDGIDEGGEGD